MNSYTCGTILKVSYSHTTKKFFEKFLFLQSHEVEETSGDQLKMSGMVKVRILVPLI